MKGLATKLVQIRKVIKDPIKRGHNKFHGYDYATKDDVFEVVRPVIAAHGVAVLPSQTGARFIDTGSTTKSGAVIRKVVVELDLLIIDEETGDSYVQHLVGESHTDDDKGIPQATTQALRFWAINTFQLLDGEVEYMDATHTTGGASQENVQRQEATPTPDECRSDIKGRIREIGFKRAQWEAFKVGLALQEEVGAFGEINHARILEWRNFIVDGEESEVSKRCMSIARKGRDAHQAA